MSIWNAIILGLVQGFAQFLPISSSGHLAILNNLFDMTTAQGSHVFFNVLLQLAAIISICVVYWQNLRQMFSEALGLVNLGPMAGVQQSRNPGARLLLMLAISALPLLLIIPIRARLQVLYSNNFVIGIFFILTGTVLFVSDKIQPGKKTAGNISILDAVIIGLSQCVSAIPGISRPGVTIAAGVSTGLRPDFAVKFSFLMSLPAVLIANIVSLVDTFRSGVDWHSVPAYLIGMAVAVIAGIVAINIIKYIFKKGKFGSFAYYCWVMGVLAMILTMIF